MAELTGKAVSELPAASYVGNADLLAISQNGASKKATKQTLLSEINNALAYNTVTDWNNLYPLDATKPTRVYGVSTGGTAANAPIAGDNITWYGYAEGYPTYYTQHVTSQYADTRSNRSREFIRTYMDQIGWTAWRETTYQVTFTPAQVSIASIAGGGYGESYVDILIPAYSVFVGAVGQYTNVALPIVGVYQGSGAASGYVRVYAGVRNTLSTAQTGVTANILAIFRTAG